MKTELVLFEDFFKYANLFYATVGVEPYFKPQSSRLRKFLTNFIFWFNVFDTNLVLFGEIVYVVLALNKSDKFEEVIMTSSFIGFVVVGIFKTFIVWREKPALTEFVRDLEIIFPKKLEIQQQVNLRKYFKQCRRISFMIACLFVTTVFLFNFIALSQYLVATGIYQQTNATQELPYHMYTPWNWNHHWSYYLLYGLESWGGYVAVTSQFSNDLLIFSAVSQLEMHFHILTQSLLSYEVQIQRSDLIKEYAFAMDLQYLRGIIQYHNLLLE